MSAYNPAAEGEGSLDPLGLEASAEHLAEQLVPGVTARMHRIRALTFMAVSAHVVEPYVDEYTADQTTPAYLAFEWMYSEAIATQGAETLSLPGFQTTSNILRARGHLAARVYIKAPAALGLHGFYRRLARATRILDDNDFLDENGEVLLRAWERDRGLQGFVDRTGEGGRALSGLRRDLERTLAASKCSIRPQSTGGLALRRNLTPGFPSGTTRERRELRRILAEDPRRAETLQIVERSPDAATVGEEQVAKSIAKRGSAELACSAKALLSFEHLAAVLTAGFEELLWSSSRDRMAPRPVDALTTDRHARLARQLPTALASAQRNCAATGPDQGRDGALDAFEGVSDAQAFVRALTARHERVQSGKGSEGKRPWFERTERGLVVRSPYVREERGSGELGFVHPARLSNCSEFLAELA